MLLLAGNQNLWRQYDLVARVNVGVVGRMVDFDLCREGRRLLNTCLQQLQTEKKSENLWV